jgi:iron uptake system EfeUOB component EfeO/EfeM
MEKNVDLLTPLLEGAAPDTARSIVKARTDIRAALDGLKQGQTDYPSYDRVDDTGRAKLANAFAAFADAVGQMNTSLGLE